MANERKRLKTSASAQHAKTSSRSKTKTAKASAAHSKEVRLLIASFLCIIVALCYYTPVFALFGIIVRNAGLALFGEAAYAIPVYFIVMLVHFFIRGTLSPHKHRYAWAAAIMVCISAFLSLYLFRSQVGYQSFGELASLSVTAATDGGISGGIAGLISVPLTNFFGPIGTGIILGCTVFILLMALTDFRLIYALASLLEKYVAYRASKPKKPREPKVKKEKFREQQISIEELRDLAAKNAEEPPPLVWKEPEAAPFDTENNFEDIDIKIFTTPQESEAPAPEPQKKDEAPIEVTDDELNDEIIPYTFPSLELLSKNKGAAAGGGETDLREQAKKLIETLKSFGVDAKILEVHKGPTVTRFEIQPSVGVKVNKIVNLADDIALNLAAYGVRIEAPIPGKAAVGIEIPNKSVMTVHLREVIDSKEFREFSSKTAFALGKDISGTPIIADIAKMPHLLIAGATGSGKSVCINSLITSILYKADPNEVKLIMIDPKVVELGVYNGIPHLLIPVVTDPRRAAGALNWAVQEMVKRYKLFSDANVRDIKGYNEYAAANEERPLSQVIIIVDELADLMMVAPHDVEDAICRLAQMARAAGMHLVIATQRPSVDVITGVIKANIPSRIAFSVSSQVDSRTILDMGGAEKLLGKGDMLFSPMGVSKPTRVQGAFISDKDVERVVAFVKDGFEAKYDEDVIEHIERSGSQENTDALEADDLLPQAIEVVIDAGQASASLLQRRLKVGYSRAGRLIDQLEERGIVGPHEGAKPRAVLLSRAEYMEMMMQNPDAE
ncbi:MAG: DNA translocase FtsK [Clostridia bacterium]|nr:DNA translocase FtsK [Clostridia bacterium]